MVQGSHRKGGAGAKEIASLLRQRDQIFSSSVTVSGETQDSLDGREVEKKKEAPGCGTPGQQAWGRL